MAFVSFKRQAMSGKKPVTGKANLDNNEETVDVKDGQFLIDTNTGYMYLDTEEKHLSIKDRKDPSVIRSDGELNAATKNGWYYLDYGKDENGKEKNFTISINGTEHHQIKSSYGHLSVDGSNNNMINQTLYLH